MTHNERNKVTHEEYNSLVSRVNNGDYLRAGGDCICPVCNKEYKRHRDVELGRREFFITVLCDNTLVKL